MTPVTADGATVTMPPIVSATAAPTSKGPSMLKNEAIRIACSGVAARVATSVAIAFDASCRPFVAANVNVNASAIASPGSIGRLYAASAAVASAAGRRDAVGVEDRVDRA